MYDQEKYKNFFPISAKDIQDSTFGKIVQKGFIEVYKYYVVSPLLKESYSNLDQIVTNINNEKIRAKAFVKKLIDQADSQPMTDLLCGIHAAAQLFATKQVKSYEDVLEDELWVIENLRDALEDDTIDGTEGEPFSKIKMDRIYDSFVKKGGDSGNEGDKE